jgi:hypothetical protein
MNHQQNIENATRADRAAQVMAEYAKLHGDDDAQTLLIDLLSDLRHYAARTEGVTFATATNTSRMHFVYESVEA